MPKEESLSDHVSCSIAGNRNFRTNHQRFREDQIVSFALLRCEIGSTNANDSRRAEPIGSFKKTISSGAVSINSIFGVLNPRV